MPEGDEPAASVVRRHTDGHLVAENDANAVALELLLEFRSNDMPVIALNFVDAVADVYDSAAKLN